MAICQRAWLYVQRNKKRTILLFLLFVVLMTISFLEIEIYAASSDAVRNLRSSIGGYFAIQTGADAAEQTDEALLQQVTTLDNVSKYNGVDTFYLYSEGMELFPGAYHNTGLVGEHVQKFIACTESSLHERFLFSSFTLIDGRQITQDDQGKAIISKEIAEYNHLAVGDTFQAGVVEGVPGWPEYTYGTQAQFEVVGIYSEAKTEVVSDTTPESELQENMVFVDIASAKQLYCTKFPDRTPEEYTYSSGFMLFVEDPEQMTETVQHLKEQTYADWSNFVISENSAAYQQAVGPIQKAERISMFLLLITCVISIGILALTLFMWTRERMTEIGILISLGISSKQICGQLLLENYIVAVPAFVISSLFSVLFAGRIGSLLGEMLEHMSLDAVQIGFVLVCSMIVILVTVLLVSISIMRKKPREILIDLS